MIYVRRAAPAPAAAAPSGWRPSLNSTRGLAVAALYISAVLVPLGLVTIIGWSALAEDPTGAFLGLAVVADLLTVALAATYVRILVLVRRGQAPPGRVLWAALASTIVGQAIAFGVLLAVGLPHMPGILR